MPKHATTQLGCDKTGSQLSLCISFASCVSVIAAGRRGYYSLRRNGRNVELSAALNAYARSLSMSPAFGAP